MQEKTRGIVLYILQYNDKYSIVHIYTEKYGRIAFFLPLLKSKKGKLSRAIFSPCTVLELDIVYSSDKTIHKISEARIDKVFFELAVDPVKNAIGLFLAEFLYRVLPEAEPNARLFSFLVNSLQVFDLITEGKANFHLVFMMQMSSYLGFQPNINDYKLGMYFDLLNGVFVDKIPLHAEYLSLQESPLFFSLMRMDYKNMHLFTFSRVERNHILERIIYFYNLHLNTTTTIKSLAVLKSLFD